MVGQPLAKRPVSVDDRIDAINTVTGAVGPLFNDLTDRVGNYPEFIRSNEDRTDLGDAVRAVARLNCRLWASSDKSNYRTGVNARNADLCGPYLAQLGENPTPGEIEREFEGGQCAGVQYKVTTSVEPLPFSDCSSFGPGISDQTYMGPIGGLRFAVENPAGELCTPGRNVVYLKHGPGNSETLLGGGGYGVRASIVSVQRVDGLPDNCGNVPPTIQPPATVTPTSPIPPSVTINLPGLGPIEVTVTLEPTGEPRVCIPLLEQCQVVPVGPEEPDGEEPGGGGGPAPGDDGQPGAGQPAGPGQDAQGEAPPGSVLVGLKMNMTTIPAGAKQYMPGAYRGAAYIYMGGNAGLDQDFAGSILANGQFVYAEKDNLTRWKVRANNDFVFNVVPYYRGVE